MITTSELLQLMSLLISVAGLFYLIGKDNHGRKNNRPRPRLRLFLHNTYNLG